MPTFHTSRLSVHASERPAQGEATRLLLIHGNVSSSAFYEPLMAALPAHFHVLAPDLRGFGDTEALPIDATRGLRDFADDIWSLLEHVGWTHGVHAAGWSTGGGVAMQLAMDHPGALASLTLIDAVSPFGFGATHGEDGTPNDEDFAGSGGGTANPAFVAALSSQDRSDAPGSPRDVLRSFYFHSFRPAPEVEERLLDSMFTTRTGDDHYPGDFTPSATWPNVAPGTRGILNALSPKYLNLSEFADLPDKPPVLWARGAHDRIVSDTSAFDFALLGSLGVVPGWPGAEQCPPQSMNAQMRFVLNRYAANGGTYREVVFERSGHSPFLEEHEAFLAAFSQHVEAAAKQPT
ncbi:alpha/beta hydrolase [Deinococcus yavapaiensis]|uniref:Pimeloyl-ACP methyl ester carboxylesterase n=1 Tax=Deinococcus yavapaiensis KR-236 TaxID=694435 RepID=A0A318S313_9DEIO|nr:alpha/beta fold hydrolase [Deinococcus yavapaiensis]PYE51805.1 pimeloyl-ACP methyl ester carboxylesterase [Deinococcus yavapaiensis KR-236]